MTVEILLYILSALMVPAIGWAMHSYIAQRDMRQKLDKLLYMHENPEKTGFGTIGLDGVIEDNTRALKSLIHYIKWLETNNGKGPPPPLEDA